MNGPELTSVEAGWARLGVQLACAPTPDTPDIERLILDSAAAIPANPRLFDLIVTWLVEFHALVAWNRLRRLVASHAHAQDRAVIGLVLDSARAIGPIGRVTQVTTLCDPLPTPIPLYEVDRASPRFARLAEAGASPLARRWGLLAPESRLRPEAIRPTRWVHDTNPALRDRAVRGGDLRASILVCLRIDTPDHAATKADLARLCAATDAATLKAVARLEHEGAVRVIRAQGVRAQLVRLIEAA